MNWGYKILFVYLLFVLGILFMVFKSSTEKTDLVSTDYYEKELKYQQTIDETKRAGALSEPVKVEIQEGKLKILFPKDFAGKKLEGEVFLYCPSDKDKDSKQHFSVQDSVLLMPVPAVAKRLYELHLTWQAEGVTYYFEKKIIF